MNTLDNLPGPGWLSWFLKGTLVLAAIILFARLGELQIIKGDYYRNLSENNRIRRIPIRAPRGKIVGQNNEVIVGSIPVKEHIVFTENGFEKNLDIKDANAADIIEEPKRNYFLGASAAHLTGYLSEVDESEVNKVDPNCEEKGPRTNGSLIGRGGLEEEYDCLLRGIDGEKLIEVDALGQPIRVLGVKQPIAGSDLITTIDVPLQQKVASVVSTLKIKTKDGDNKPEGRKGAVVITDGKGAVLAIYSAPSFDPSIFTSFSGQAPLANKVNEVVTNPNLPLFNRTIHGLYHPGSTFKIVTSAAALEEKKIDEDFLYKDTGYVELNGYKYDNWFWASSGGTEGEINLVRSIARSTDTFFYKVGEMIGIDKLSGWAKKFRLDKPTGVDLPNEAQGLIPDPSWKRQVKGELWFLGDTFNVSIGQGDVELTPLAANFLAASIANKGKLCTPHISTTADKSCTDLNLAPKTIDLIKQGMIEACSTGGTAFPFFEFEPRIACKTGTAETGDNDETHAWFAAFAPIDNPKIVIDVIIEKGGQGSEVAAPISKEILNYYFGRTNN